MVMVVEDKDSSNHGLYCFIRLAIRGLIFLGVVCDLSLGHDKALDKGDQRKD